MMFQMETAPGGRMKMKAPWFAAVLLAIGWPVLSIGGNLQIFELAFIVYFAFSFLISPRFLFPSRLSRVIFGFGIAWLLAQFVTDVVRGTLLVNALRGMGNIGMYIVMQAIFVSVIGSEQNRIAPILMGLSVGKAAATFLVPSELQVLDPWKFGYGSAAAILVLVMLGVIRAPRMIMACALMAFGFLGFYLGARSMAALNLIAALLFLFSGPSSVRGRFRGRLPAVLAVAVGAFGVVVGYQYAVSMGLFGATKQEKFEMQINAGLVVGGRSELWGSIPAILDSPLLGYGSWAESDKYVELRIAKLRDAGIQVNEFSESTLIPTHSHLFGAWVQSGLVGAFYWIVMFVLVGRALMLSIDRDLRNKALIQLLLVSFLWAILFSPLGLGSRVTSALAGALVISLISYRYDRYSPRTAVVACRGA